jgi:hypothetical protein
VQFASRVDSVTHSLDFSARVSALQVLALEGKSRSGPPSAILRI